MQDMSDKELDDLFKEAAEGFTPPPDTAAWQQMASMLDKSPLKPAGFWNWKTISVFTASGLIAITALWYGLTDREGTNTKTTEQYRSDNATQGISPQQQEQANPANTESFAAAIQLEDESSNLSTVDDSSRRREKSSVAPHVEHDEEEKLISDNSENANAVKHYADVELPVSTTSGDVTDRLSSSDATVNTAPDEVIELPAPVKLDSLVSPGQNVKTDSVTESTEKDSEREENNKAMRLSIKAIVSPDFSSINFFSAGKTGINYGILAGFSFNNRWSVFTGVISSRKLYNTKDVSGNYNLDGYPYPMKEIDGDCRIIDIPLNVYYTFFPDRSFSLRAGLGFSSYIMRTEKYRYLVDYFGNDVYYKKNIKGENNEWFKVMNVSVVVSRKLSNRFSAEFEPFVKAPLAGVGEGKISLVSMGAFVNLKYDF
jgi:hypothetical protein